MNMHILFLSNRTQQKRLLTKLVSWLVILKCLFIIWTVFPQVLCFSVTIATLHHQRQNLQSRQPVLKHRNQKRLHIMVVLTSLDLVCGLGTMFSISNCTVVVFIHTYEHFSTLFEHFVHFLDFLHFLYIFY